MHKQIKQPQNSAKKPYQQPKLTQHGDVRRLTKNGPVSGKEGPGVGNTTRKA